MEWIGDDAPHTSPHINYTCAAERESEEEKVGTPPIIASEFMLIIIIIYDLPESIDVIRR